MSLVNSHTFLVFDLDDTLYKERSYVLSGIAAVACHVREIYGTDVTAALHAWESAGVRDLWGSLCDKLGLSPKVKSELLSVYRSHEPSIALPSSTQETLARLRVSCAGLAILTDGRSTTQRAKLLALGLDDLPCYISEEYGSEKPEHVRFAQIEQEYPAQRYVYIADNPKKDFKGPNERGWVTVGLIGDRSNVHCQKTDGLDDVYLPDLWISSIEELQSLAVRGLSPPAATRGRS